MTKSCVRVWPACLHASALLAFCCAGAAAAAAAAAVAASPAQQEDAARRMEEKSKAGHRNSQQKKESENAPMLRCGGAPASVAHAIFVDQPPTRLVNFTNATVRSTHPTVRPCAMVAITLRQSTCDSSQLRSLMRRRRSRMYKTSAALSAVWRMSRHCWALSRR